MQNEHLKLLEKKIGYSFVNEQFLLTSLTHSSFSNENKNLALAYESYERMEFFGDAILEFLVSEMLYTNYSNLSEGKLTKLRALLVCEETLNNCAVELELSKHIFMSSGSVQSGGLERPSILADVVESIVAAIYLDGGIEPARTFVMKILNKHISLALEGRLHSDYKSALQESVQGSSRKEIKYVLATAEGPVHERTFMYDLYIGGIFFGSGTGKTKKEAQQQAAKVGMEKLP